MKSTKRRPGRPKSRASSDESQSPETPKPLTGEARAEAVIRFVESLKTPSGKHAGKLIRLREWQKSIIRRIYGPCDEAGRRLVRRVLLLMAKKNGKTTLIAALVLVHLVGPEAIPGAEIYSAANDREQASIVYRAAAAMVEMDDELRELVRPIPSRKRLVCYQFGSFYQALSSDSRAKQGMSPTVWIYDELGTCPKEDLYHALDTAQGAWDEPLSFVISTQAVDPKALLSQLVDDARRVLAGEVTDPTLAAFLFEVPQEADPFDEAVWPLANPALGDFLSLEDMRNDAEKARRLPSRLNIFRNFRLNQQVQGLEQIFNPDDWKACALPVDRAALRGLPCYGGLDLSARRALTALTLAFPCDDGITRVLVRVWTPADGLADRALRDRAPYEFWRDNGVLITPPGKSIDYAYVAQEIGALAAEFDIRGIAFDRWRIEDLRRELDAEGIRVFIEERDGKDAYEPDALRLVNWGQGFKDMAPAIDALETLVVNHQLAHAGHPILTWAASNAITTRDAAGNRKLDKAKARNHIDPLQALAMAIGLADRPPEDDFREITQGIVNIDALAKEAAL